NPAGITGQAPRRRHQKPHNLREKRNDMKTNSILTAAVMLFAGFAHWETQGQVALTGTQYHQTFNSIGSGLPAGWSLRTNATATALGIPTAFNAAAANWSATTG